MTVASVDLGEKAKAAGANEEPDTVRERVRAAALELRRKEEEDVLGALAVRRQALLGLRLLLVSYTMWILRFRKKKKKGLAKKKLYRLGYAVSS